MVKISQLPPDSSPTTTDSIPTYDVESGSTKRSLISSLITLFFNNIPTGSASPVTRFDEAFDDFVYTGGIWTGDSYGVTLNASMTTMTVYINGRRLTIAAVTARAFTASKDTYVDVLDNLDGTGTLVYTAVANGAASPALAANSIRVAKIVSGATNIAAATSISQTGGPDSLGNIIYNKVPVMRQAQPLLWRQGGSATDWSAVGTTNQDVRGLAIQRHVGAVLVNANPTNVVYKNAYVNPPIIQATMASATSANAFVICTARTTTTAGFRTVNDAGVVVTTENINWSAEGI